jgi:[CysO sulfur-carrier protein]-S-L-cysteine hydrolase
MKHVALPRTLVNQLLTHAQKHPEREVCGLIAADGGRPTRVWPVDNVAQNADHLFRMDPKEQIDAMRAMREAGEDLFAIYHSHPHAPPLPSVTDLEQVGYPEALYLIISLDTKGVLQMNGYYLTETGGLKVVDLSVEN